MEVSRMTGELSVSAVDFPPFGQKHSCHPPSCCLLIVELWVTVRPRQPNCTAASHLHCPPPSAPASAPTFPTFSPASLATGPCNPCLPRPTTLLALRPGACGRQERRPIFFPQEHVHMHSSKYLTTSLSVNCPFPVIFTRSTIHNSIRSRPKKVSVSARKFISNTAVSTVLPQNVGELRRPRPAALPSCLHGLLYRYDLCCKTSPLPSSPPLASL